MYVCALAYGYICTYMCACGSQYWYCMYMPTYPACFFNMSYRTNLCSKILYQLSHISSLLPIYYFEMVSHILGWLHTYYVAQDGLGLLNFQPLPPKSCEYRHVPPHPIYKILGTEPRSVVGIKPRASSMLDKTLSIKSYRHALFFIF